MVLREPRPGAPRFDPFYGCSQYPECKGARNIDENGNPEQTPEEEEEALVQWLRT